MIKYQIPFNSKIIPIENFFYTKESFIYKNLFKITKDLSNLENLLINFNEKQVIFNNIVYELEKILQTEDINDFLLYFHFEEESLYSFKKKLKSIFITNPSKNHINTFSKIISDPENLKSEPPFISSFVSNQKLLSFIIKINNYLTFICSNTSSMFGFINSVNQLFLNLTTNGINDKSSRINTYKNFFEEKLLIFYSDKLLSSDYMSFDSLSFPFDYESIFNLYDNSIKTNDTDVLYKAKISLLTDVLYKAKISLLINLTYIEMKEIFDKDIPLFKNLICVNNKKQVEKIMILNQSCFYFFNTELFSTCLLEQKNIEIKKENLLSYICKIFKSVSKNEDIINQFYLNMEKYLLNEIHYKHSKNVKDNKRL